MSETLATSPRMDGEAATVEGRLADLMREAEVRVDGYRLSQEDRAKVIAALEGAVSVRERALEEAAYAADCRAVICEDACRKIAAGKLYQGIPTAFASENCARLEAIHIASLIRKMKDIDPFPSLMIGKPFDHQSDAASSAGGSEADGQP